ncbi:hypothetical protein P3T76_008760 [Phytophthora citrophthora]|uniref:Uncharacterized protein n=1 Tax=Phytophthora citrophthora TaxID=4793 RepID=A0AAD9GJN2_9STRA|nr:hypothetical protein P3T76_008760 [Phytophthora citrophthora]
MLYLLRLVPLTRRVDGVVQWTATGRQLPIAASHAPEVYEGKFVVKYGCTVQPARVRFAHIVTVARQRNFPAAIDLDPRFEMAIMGIPIFQLRNMESALRNYLERRGFRLRWYALEEEPMEDWQPGDDPQDDDPLEVNTFAEQFELVCTDETGNELAGVFQELTDALETGRLGARDHVIAAVQFADVISKCNAGDCVRGTAASSVVCVRGFNVDGKNLLERLWNG